MDTRFDRNAIEDEVMTRSSRRSDGEDPRQRKRLIDTIGRFTPTDGQHQTSIPELALYRRSGPTEPNYALYEPSISLIAQGAKRVVLGSEEYDYDTSQILITAVNLPTVSEVTRATREKPYLGLMLKLCPRSIGQVIAEGNLPPTRMQEKGRGLAVGPLTAQLMDAVERLLGLLDEPQHIPVLAPLVQKEILYWLLTGPQGVRLRQIAVTGNQAHRIAQAIEYLKNNCTKPVSIDELAEEVSLGVSTLHHHFRALTAMSPLQYQKHFRLHEARRIMLTEHLDAATVSLRVGYESPSQFGREYARLFGAPPVRDVARIRHQEFEQAQAMSTSRRHRINGHARRAQ